MPCPTLDITGGFQKYFDKAVGKTSNPPFDPYKNDVNFLLATFSLEEIGATGDKVCTGVWFLGRFAIKQFVELHHLQIAVVCSLFVADNSSLQQYLLSKTCL